MSSIGIAVPVFARDEAEKEVSAVEDLMREHGVLRRALLVYKETAPKLRENATPAMTGALQKTARLFRTFGEDYHETKLEEAHIFPELQKKGGLHSSLVATLIEQHKRGRQVTDYILQLTLPGEIGRKRAAELAGVLDAFILMYQNHAAREDTVVFPAWKEILPAGEIEEMGEEFEDIEHEQFGEDGFEKAVREIAEIEQNLGLSDIGQFTPPQPPQS